MTRRPKLRLGSSSQEIQRFVSAHKRAESDGDYDHRLALGDQLFVREQLVARWHDVASPDRREFEARADLVVELAYFAGIAVALAFINQSTREIELQIARSQEQHSG